MFCKKSTLLTVTCLFISQASLGICDAKAQQCYGIATIAGEYHTCDGDRFSPEDFQNSLFSLGSEIDDNSEETRSFAIKPPAPPSAPCACKTPPTAPECDTYFVEGACESQLNDREQWECSGECTYTVLCNDPSDNHTQIKHCSYIQRRPNAHIEDARSGGQATR